MSYHSIVDISCLRVFLTKTLSSNAPCSGLSPIHLDLGIDGFHSLPSSTMVAYGSCQYLRSRCIGERLKHGELRTQSFVKKTLRHEISTGKIAHGNDKGRNTVIRDVITIDTVVTELSLKLHPLLIDAPSAFYHPILPCICMLSSAW